MNWQFLLSIYSNIPLGQLKLKPKSDGFSVTTKYKKNVNYKMLMVAKRSKKFIIKKEIENKIKKKIIYFI